MRKRNVIIFKMANHRAKRARANRINHICGTFDVMVFKVIVGSFGALFENLTEATHMWGTLIL